MRVAWENVFLSFAFWRELVYYLYFKTSFKVIDQKFDSEGTTFYYHVACLILMYVQYIYIYKFSQLTSNLQYVQVVK